jgi:hypothetical protein
MYIYEKFQALQDILYLSVRSGWFIVLNAGSSVQFYPLLGEYWSPQLLMSVSLQFSQFKFYVFWWAIIACVHFIDVLSCYCDELLINI